MEHPCGWDELNNHSFLHPNTLIEGTRPVPLRGYRPNYSTH